MKIGLLSYHRNYNYGWNLQCYALMTVLKSLGHEVSLIDKMKFSNQSCWGRLKNACARIFHLNRGKSYEEVQKERGVNIAPFFDNYIFPRTHCINNQKGYRKLPRFDALVVGSDQVWRKKLVNPLADYFFNFIDYPAILISYAASFGVDYAEYSDEEINRCGKLIERFKAVSVRERSGVKLIKDVYKWRCNPIVMPDPTLLLPRHDYEKISGVSMGQTSGLFCYILDMTDDKEKVIDKISTIYSLQPKIISLDEEKAYPSVEEWLQSFRDAEFVFTDSFHGCVFSLIFRKPFIAYGNAKRGIARFVSLLDSFGLRERLIESSSGMERMDMQSIKNINKEHLDAVQDEMRKKALDFLSKELR